MKKLFFTTGIIIILIGAVATANYNTEIMYSKLEKAVYEAPKNSWEVSGYFNKGEKLTVYCVPAANWSQGPMDEDDTIYVPHRHIWFEIVDPNGSITEYNTAWTAYSSSGATVPFSQAQIWVTNRTGGLFVPQDEPTYVGGVAALNGIYTARVVDEFEPSYARQENPPYYLALDRESPLPTYPYTYLLPVGGFTMAVGIVISAFSAKSKKKQHRERTSRT